MNEKQLDPEKVTNIALPILLCIVSLIVGFFFVTPKNSGRYISYLDDKKTTVLELTAASTAASVAVSMVPGDAGTPIAEKLADLSGYSMLILCALFLEKYLVTITGAAAFRFLIPGCCLLYLAGVFNPKWENFKPIARKVGAFALVLYFIIPVSVETSKMIEKTYQDSIQETINTAKEDAAEIQDYAGSSEDESLWSKFISTIEGGVSGITAQFEQTLNNFIEAIAVLIVTSCVIPILVLVFMVWIIRMTFGIDRRMPPLLPAGMLQRPH